MSLPIVRAVDVGYGYTKYVTSTNNRTIQCAQFPSVVPRAAKGSLSAAMGGKRNTITVRIGGEDYEVGPDAELAQSGLSFDRVMTTDFASSKSYLALISGALYYMGQTHIDMLILGLPVNTWETHKRALEDNFQNTSISVGERTITIDKVKIVPQPYGGYITLANDSIGLDGVENVLVIDPGFGTLDWIVVNEGKINDARCGAAAGLGMSSVLAAVKREIEREYPGCEIGNIQRLDHAIRNGRPFRLYSDEIHLGKYRPTMDAITADAIANLANNLGGSSDIEVIALVGGPAQLYENAVRERFPRNRVVTLQEPGYANVRGFQNLGLMWAASRMQQVA